jgi:hypothetical protein
VIDLEVRDGWVGVHHGTSVVVSPTEECIRAVNPGKSSSRREGIAQRPEPHSQAALYRPDRQAKEPMKP